MKNTKPHKIEKTIIKNMIKGGFCSKYGNNACGQIETEIDLMAPLSGFLNMILNILQYPINNFSKGLNFVINQWNENIYKLSTILEQFILLIIFTINGYTSAVNYYLEDIRLSLKILVMILTAGGPVSLISLYIMPVVNELISFTLDSATLDIITSLFTLDFTPLFNFIKAFFYLLIGRTIKSKCNLEDYGNNKHRMKEECYEFVVPRCKVNIKTLFYITFTMLILLYISCWISFFKIFYPD